MIDVDIAPAMVALVPEPILCYVRGDWAYFTTCPLAYQWGDDWNDAPYEHNAGRPYTWKAYNLEKQGIPPYSVMQIAVQVDLEQPDEWVSNSGYSVEMINNRAVPWYQTGRYGVSGYAIWAGTPISEFRKLIRAAGGGMWEPAW